LILTLADCSGDSSVVRSWTSAVRSLGLARGGAGAARHHASSRTALLRWSGMMSRPRALVTATYRQSISSTAIFPAIVLQRQLVVARDLILLAHELLIACPFQRSDTTQARSGASAAEQGIRDQKRSSGRPPRSKGIRDQKPERRRGARHEAGDRGALRPTRNRPRAGWCTLQQPRRRTSRRLLRSVAAVVACRARCALWLLGGVSALGLRAVALRGVRGDGLGRWC
jgi:hypothetical protein